MSSGASSTSSAGFSAAAPLPALSDGVLDPAGAVGVSAGCAGVAGSGLVSGFASGSELALESAMAFCVCLTSFARSASMVASASTSMVRKSAAATVSPERYAFSGFRPTSLAASALSRMALFSASVAIQSPVLATLSMGVACAAYATPAGAVPGVCARPAKAGAVAMDVASTAASAAFVKMVPCFITLSYRLSLFDLVSLV